MRKEELSTPALLIELDVLEKNIRTMSEYYRGRKNAGIMPHQKGHRLPIIAKKQAEGGARGVSMTSLGLAEYFVQSGIDNILITSEIYGKSKIDKLCGLAKQANITISVDNLKNVRQLSEIALENHTVIKVAAELYAGRASCGVEFSKVKHFVKDLSAYRGIQFEGFWHHGQESSIVKFPERKIAHFNTLDEISRTKDEIEDAGTEVRFVSAGCTCTWNMTPEHSLKNVLVQAGSYVFSDWCSHNHLEGIEAFDCALTVLTRCISRPKTDEAMFDFGMNSCSDECGENYHNVVGPVFKGIEGVDTVSEREEVSLAVFKGPRDDVKVGDVSEVIPAHSDTTAKLHARYYGIRDGVVEVVWPNYGQSLF
jgi:D-serine deaminase-like pyridoxal phosphate-dependent protein